MRLRMTVVFVVVLALFGWVVSLAVSHYIHLSRFHDQASQQHHIRFVLTVFMTVLFPVLGAIVWYLVGRTLAPLRTLSQQAETSTGGRLVSPSSDKEMTELVSTLNHLLERIEASAEAKARFYAAASHELRTPLQALGGHIETSLGQERTAEEYREALAEAQKQTQRLTTLTRDILMLHQLQTQVPEPSEQTCISESVESALRELGPLFEARGLSLHSTLADQLSVHGKQSYADVCIRNLVENAARYASPDSEVSLSLSPHCFEIRNACSLDSKMDLEGFFEPFAASKGVGSSGGGNGLGLAICRAAAHANRWSVRLEQIETSVLATVTFPG